MLDIPTTMIEIGETENQAWIIDMINNILIEVLTSLAEQERKSIKERQAQGIAQMPINPKTNKRRSLRTGNDVGRPKAQYPMNWETVYREWKAGEITAVRAIDKTGLTKATFYNLVKRYEGEEK